MSVQVPAKWDSVKEYIAVLIEIAEKLKQSDNNWSHLKINEDFNHHYGTPPLGALYKDGRQFVGDFKDYLLEFLNPETTLLLKDYVEHVQNKVDFWLPILEKTASEGKAAIEEVDDWPFAINEMHRLIKKQIEFLQTVSETLKILRGTKLYLVETGQQLPYERPLKWWNNPFPVMANGMILGVLLSELRSPVSGWLAQFFSGGN